jgi:hypothetical protein
MAKNFCGNAVTDLVTSSYSNDRGAFLPYYFSINLVELLQSQTTTTIMPQHIGLILLFDGGRNDSTRFIEKQVWDRGIIFNKELNQSGVEIVDATFGMVLEEHQRWGGVKFGSPTLAHPFRYA